MPFMKKEELHAEAERLGVDIEGLPYHEQNKRVLAAIEAESATSETTTSNDEELLKARQEIEELKKQLRSMQTSNDPEAEAEGSAVASKKFATTIMAPEIRATGVQLVKYDEELGEDVTVEEISFKDEFEKNSLMIDRDVMAGTYKIKSRNGRNVIAQSTLPKINAGVRYNPDMDLVPVVTYRGKSGYIWTHHHYPNIKELLKASGRYQKYKHLFNAKENPNNIWYAAGKLLVVDRDVVHAVFQEIEADYAAGR